ncbi:hypothetical protein EVAR_60596_1 [Eumeta japonica]|uniref:Uncharacterized protein n=1 Tax=Eumeta variegata TaxID=151549 RepID=A0A4C1YEY0_EUMVA|nr:hypothetical protein EVAR_60596_1 [Eumeta japonica]
MVHGHKGKPTTYSDQLDPAGIAVVVGYYNYATPRNCGPESTVSLNTLPRCTKSVCLFSKDYGIRVNCARFRHAHMTKTKARPLVSELTTAVPAAACGTPISDFKMILLLRQRCRFVLFIVLRCDTLNV